jgi:uncharacterized protein YcfJ
MALRPWRVVWLGMHARRLCKRKSDSRHYAPTERCRRTGGTGMAWRAAGLSGRRFGGGRAGVLASSHAGRDGASLAAASVGGEVGSTSVRAPPVRAGRPGARVDDPARQ